MCPLYNILIVFVWRWFYLVCMKMIRPPIFYLFNWNPCLLIIIIILFSSNYSEVRCENKVFKEAVPLKGDSDKGVSDDRVQLSMSTSSTRSFILVN